jgi:hypothetical protein
MKWMTSGGVNLRSSAMPIGELRIAATADVRIAT